MASLTLTNLTKTFPGGSRAVDRVSLDIHDGEFLVLVGPSGCGKSTTLRMIAGLEEISGGEIRIGERVVNAVPPKDRNISMVFQNYALYPHMNVRKNLSFGLELRYGGGIVERALRRVLKPGKAASLNRKRQTIVSRVERTAELLKISHLLARMPGQLSGGERQRVALGRAIVREPEVFLFDEPLSNLDAKLRVEMRRELKQLHRRLGTTMIYVTHDQVEAMTLGDRVAVMNQGRLQQAGPPLELYDRPANRFVASFLGSPSMNLLECVGDSSGSIRLQAAGAEVEVNDQQPRRGTMPDSGEDRPAPLPHELNKSAAARLEGLLGGQREGAAGFTIGIRPEDIALGDPGEAEPPDAIALEAEVVLVESLGDSALATLKLLNPHQSAAMDSPLLIVKINRQEQLQTGQRKSVIFPVSRLHLFTGANGERVKGG